VAANNLAYLMLMHNENPNVAFTLAQTARKGLPNLPNSADTLGWAYYSQGVYSAAADLLEEAIKADPKNPNYHYHLGMVYEKQANYPLAKKQFEDALQINPNYTQAAEIRKMLAESHN
jgi:Tfp pilus assembly protein PilF